MHVNIFFLELRSDPHDPAVLTLHQTDLELDRDLDNYSFDALKFKDFTQGKGPIRHLPEQYQHFLLMDIFHQLDREKIYELGIIEYEEMLNYAVTTYKLRIMQSSEKKSHPSNTIHFNQPADFDVDPNFRSQVNKSK